MARIVNIGSLVFAARCLLILIGGFAFSCSAPRSDNSSQPDALDKKPIANRRAKPDEPLIIYQKGTNAFGTSRAEKLTIYPSGRLIYERIPTVPMPTMGGDQGSQKFIPIEGNLNNEELENLLQDFDLVNFMSMRNGYASTDDGCPRVISDQGSISITFNGADGQKKVDHYLGCVENTDDISHLYPSELKNIEQQLDRLTVRD